MKPTGVIRRLDDMGRIVIPKNVRRTLKWEENDSIEISAAEDGCVTLRKYVSSDQDEVLQITGQVEDILRHGLLKGAARDYLQQAFTELKCAVEELTLTAQEGTEASQQ